MSQDALAAKSGAERLAGKVAVVVGAGQSAGSGPDDETIGNGRAVAMLFAREGAQVLAVDRDPVSLQETRDLITSAGGSVQTLVVDITDEEQVEKIAPACLDAFGSIDILHNNVGISVAGGDAEISKIEGEAFDRIMAINLKSMVIAIKHALPVMRGQQRGNIINISSTAAHEDYPWVTYKASKAAAKAMTEQVALQNAPHGIRVNTIRPTVVLTELSRAAWDPAALEVMKQQIPLKRLATPATWLRRSPGS